MPESFVIGGTTIRPGHRATVNLPVAELSTHTPIDMPVHVIRGRRDGPTLFVCAALHGDEINGVEIIRRFLRLSALKHLRGTLVAVPVVNVFGFLAQSRYLPDGRDLNRSFPGSMKGSLAARVAQIFMSEVVAKCSHGVDLHTGASRRTNFPQIRADLDHEETSELASSFGVPLIIDASLRQGSLRKSAMEMYDVPVLVYEAGEALRFDETCIRAGVNGLTRVARQLGMLPKSRRAEQKLAPVIVRSTQWMRAPASGVFRALASHGAQVRKGTVLGVISDPFGENEVSIVAERSGIIIGYATLPLVHEGDALFHIGRVEGRKAIAEALDMFEPNDLYISGLTSELTDELPIVNP